MAEEVKYNNTLVSGRADETLTYTKYVKDEGSGKSTKELLDEKVNKTDQLGTTQIADKAVTTEKLAEHSVDNSKLSQDSVSYDKIQNDAVITEKIQNGAVTTEKVEEKAVTNQKLGDQSVDGRVVREASLETKHFANESVTTEKVARKSITKDKLSDNSVDASQVVDGSIGNAKLSPDSVTTEKIKDSSVTNEKVADDTLGIEKFDPELRKTIQAATGLPDDLSQMIQNVDKSIKRLNENDTDLQSQINNKQEQITANKSAQDTKNASLDENMKKLNTRDDQITETLKNISATGGASVASAVTYDNTTSQLTSANIQGAVDELQGAKIDKTSILQESGEAEDKVMSQKAVSAKLSDLSEKTSNIIKNKTTAAEDEIIITNKNEDEIILEIADSGVSAKNLKSNGIDIIDELDKKVTKDLLNTRTDGINHEQSQSAENEVIFGKSEENPSLVIGEESVKVKSITDLQGNPIGGRLPLLGKELFTIGDSLSTSGIWQQKVSTLTGCTFDVEKNTKNGSELSQGGTTTNEASLHSGIIRAFNLKVNNYSPDIILLQNINDQTCFDDKGNNKYESGTAYGKKAFVPTQIIEGGAYSQWENNASSYLGTINISDRKFGSIIKFESIKNGKKISISNLPTSNGNIRITINGVSADISVSSAETKASIIHKIFEYNYGNDIQKNENLNATNPYVEFYTSSASLTLAYTDSDSTSMTIVPEDKQINTVVLKYFLGESLQNWQNVDSWKNGLTPYQAWKGMIEFCILNYPTAKIALLMFPRFKLDKNLYINKDGTFNQDVYNEKDIKDGDSEAIKKEKIDRIKCRARISLQEDVAQFYNLPIIDLNKDCGINVGNYLSFYPNNNVHPTDFGYEFYGSIIANKIINI